MKVKVTQAQHDTDPVLTRAVNEDKVVWYKKPNLRYLYLFLFPTCMGIEVTRQVVSGRTLASCFRHFSEDAVQLCFAYPIRLGWRFCIALRFI